MARSERQKNLPASEEVGAEKKENKAEGISAADVAVEKMIAENREKAEVKRDEKREGATETKSGNAPQKYDVRVGLFPSEGPVRGVCTVTIGGEFAVKNVKVVEGSKGLFVSMPSYKSGDEYRDLFFPVTKEARAELQEAVLSEYERQVQIHKYDACQGGQAPQTEAPKGTLMPALS